MEDGERWVTFIARHRLKRLAQTELEPGVSVVLGLIHEEAVAVGATRELLIVLEACKPRQPAGPLSCAQQAAASLAKMAKRRASDVSAS